MGKKNRNPWSVAALPGTLQAHVREYRRSAALLREGGQTLGMTERYEQSARTFDRQADLCVDLTLPLYWVTSPMAQVALDASLDLPTLSPNMAPTRRGFLAVEGGLPPLPAPQAEGWWTLGDVWVTEGIAPRALLWDTTPQEFTLTVFTHESQMPGGTRTSRGPLQELLTIGVPRALGGSWAPVAPTGADADPAMASMEGLDPVPVSDSQIAVLAWACATWHLMMMPTLAERRSLDPRTGGEPSPAGPPPARVVTHIDLRPLRQVNVEPVEDGAAAPVRTHRWVVRGHWVQQPYGPGQSQRRLQWRESYIKGPAGAPLLRSRPVNVWRR